MPEPTPSKTLATCTPRDKAMLGLWRVLGEVLGDHEMLCGSAQRYHAAAYQRHAARRLVSSLDRVGGAMLCDGVGLGKTYVAATVILHYLERWEEEADTHRVTVLAPAAVVQTWRVEAIGPLARYNEAASRVRVLSHTMLSRITSVSEALAPREDGVSDLEHLARSELVIVDEAHNFRAGAAMRTRALRDLLAIPTRREHPRRVLLLTATPINNSLDDLAQELSLMFSQPTRLPLREVSAEAYPTALAALLHDRAAQARAYDGAGRSSVAALFIHGDAGAPLQRAPTWRSTLDRPIAGVGHIGDYLRAQSKLLESRRALVKEGGQLHDAPPIASALLDQVVVQRSRALCQALELQEGEASALLFRAPPGQPEPLRYEDRYQHEQGVLERYLSLFDPDKPKLGLRVYLWHAVMAGQVDPSETVPALALQRVLALKRLESSPVTFLISLLRLVALYCARLDALRGMVGQPLVQRLAALEARFEADIPWLLWLCAGTHQGGLGALARAHAEARGLQPPDDVPEQLRLDEEASGAADAGAEHLTRFGELLCEELEALLEVAPKLAAIVFGPPEDGAWPARFIAVHATRSWPQGAAWAWRAAQDAKLCALLGALARAAARGQRAVVFSQFSDTLDYIGSVLAACARLGDEELGELAGALGVELGALEAVLGGYAVLHGQSEEDREAALDRFAPYYRVRPQPPQSDDPLAVESWADRWAEAARRPVRVLCASDILAEGVNLQDAALLIHFDLHWNPVRMIQRSGRIDRRLNPQVEGARRFPELEQALAARGLERPAYSWHEHPDEPPQIMNMLLPDALERELALRERIALKALAIDLTLGLEFGTGAEADWMEDYRWRGVAALGAAQADRALEQLIAARAQLKAYLEVQQIPEAWSVELNAWLRQSGAAEDAPLLISGQVTPKGEQAGRSRTRWLKPWISEGVACWPWIVEMADASELSRSHWIKLDAQAWPPQTIAPAPPAPAPAEATAALTPERLLPFVSAALPPNKVVELELDATHRRQLYQGLSALTPGQWGSDAERRALVGARIFVFQRRV